MIESMNDTDLVRGMSMLSIEYKKADSSHYFSAKELKATSEDFKQYIQLDYDVVTKTLTVSCRNKQKHVLAKFIGTNQYS